MRLKIRKIGPKSMKMNDDGTEQMEDPGKVEKVSLKPNRKKRLMKRG